MKRQPALIPLSREHHDALSYARRAIAASDGPAAAAAREHTLAFWDDCVTAHLTEEERILLPALSAAGAPREAAVALAHHHELRTLTARLRDGDLAALAAWGKAMHEHVRYEERELFPLAERLLDLTALAFTPDRAPPAGKTHS